MSEQLLRRDLTESALCYNYCDVLKKKKKGLLEKNINPKTTQLVCESQWVSEWVSGVLNWSSAFDLKYHLCLHPTFENTSYRLVFCFFFNFMHECMIFISLHIVTLGEHSHQRVGQRVCLFGSCFPCWDISLLISVHLCHLFLGHWIFFRWDLFIVLFFEMFPLCHKHFPGLCKNNVPWWLKFSLGLHKTSSPTLWWLIGFGSPEEWHLLTFPWRSGSKSGCPCVVSIKQILWRQPSLHFILVWCQKRFLS